MIPALLLLALQDSATPESARAAQRLELRRDVAKTNGVWKLHEWGHYFVVTDVNEPTFLDQLERRTFLAREACVRLFPESESDPVRDDRRLVVLRALRNAQEYQSYGGPGGSNGYWSTVSGEIVVHDDSDRGETWEALAGCVAGAYLDELFGNAPRAAWFEVGMSQYAISAVGSPSRAPVELEHWPALESFLEMSYAGYRSRLSEVPDVRLVAGSLLRFLCDEELRGEDFDPRWAKIPERYAVGWVALKDEQKARAFAFEGIDRAALERAWRASLVPR